ncbi:SUMO-interacting motif-containing protein 1 isoform X2 [Sceloporus undulatus]|uniref:SUMO-interacting motif-containing protein 1 isoform X2 n=1 Tax=Sceloporus undulatus TaxID=8520 RepID=UPI001C4B36F2|nr:SUMO-interacting motif-containing protein 1 isoform X2 [Sceloporus undulatus]
MAEEEAAVFSSESEDGGSSGRCPRRRRPGGQRPRKGRGLRGPVVEVIDLTGDDYVIVRTAAYSDFDVVDLTEAEETIVSPLHDIGYATRDLKHSTPISLRSAGSPKIPTTTDPEIQLEEPIGTWNGDSVLISTKKETVEKPCFQSSSFSITTTCGTDLESISHTTYNSDLGSLGSPQLDSDAFSFSSANEDSECQASWECVEDPPNPCPLGRASTHQPSPLFQRHCPSPPSCCSPMDVSPSQAETDQPLLEAKNPAPSAVTLNVQQPAEKIDIKVWLKTLQYFKGVPIHHPFLQNVVQHIAQNKQLKVNPIPCRRLSMVSSTIEENFFPGTLDFLMDYVSSQHYPPKEVTSYVVRNILLSTKHEDMQEKIHKDAYLLLVKIQALHPAKVDTVVWDWPLLREVMEDEEGKFPGRLLFLQYVIQTLVDDFERTIKIGLLHKSIAKAVLSCDDCSSNIKEVTEWLICAVTGVRLSQYKRNLQRTRSPSLETFQDESSSSMPDLHLGQTSQRNDNSSQWQTKKEIALFQKMLSIAVEVHKFPNCSATKIADMVFSSVMNIPKRCQREAFLSSMECDLLRCKVLELIFQHSTIPTDDPLSLRMILHFMQSFSLPVMYQIT